MNGYDQCESCMRIGATIALEMPAIAHHEAATFNLCGYCIADAFAHGKRS